jgi:hypothetical protein
MSDVVTTVMNAAVAERVPPGGPGVVDPDRMTTVRQFLAEKAALPSAAPHVP